MFDFVRCLDLPQFVFPEGYNTSTGNLFSLFFVNVIKTDLLLAICLWLLLIFNKTCYVIVFFKGWNDCAMMYLVTTLNSSGHLFLLEGNHRKIFFFLFFFFYWIEFILYFCLFIVFDYVQMCLWWFIFGLDVFFSA